MAEHAPTLVVGNGLIGAAVADRLRAAGRPAITVSRNGAGHLSCDLSAPDGLALLRSHLREVRPGRVVLTHGPSDVTWIERHETEAAAMHVGGAELLAELALPTVLISTDNVFPGDEGARTPDHPVRPGNAYGRLKLTAERALLAAGHGLALRVSLVYGWTGTAHRATYGQRCLESAARNEVLQAPTDQSFTPIHVADVAQVVAALCAADELPVGVSHLSGPEELSRYDFATTAYRLAGADPGLVRPCLRKDTEWASRPRYSSLACDDFAVVPGWRPMSPADGLRSMLTEAARGAA
jgi:dTDP-4-dehydrorhamnose reductase